MRLSPRLGALVLAVAAAACAEDVTQSEDLTRNPLLENPSDRPVAPPGFVDGEVLEGGAAEFTWTDSNEDEDGYILQRRLPNTSAWALLGVYPPDTTGAVDENTTERATYFYRVAAFRATEVAASSAIRLTFLDKTPPDTTILLRPPKLTADRSAVFYFRSNEPEGTFTCSFDGGTYPCIAELGCATGESACLGTMSLGGLTTGDHAVEITATDAAGNADPTPARFEWTVDIDDPEVTITSKPSDPTDSHIAAFEFEVDEADVAVECSLNGEPFSACGSPFSEDMGPFPPENPSFEVRATDSLGNSGTASYAWNVDIQGPVLTFTETPAPLSVSLTAGFDARVVLDVSDKFSPLSPADPSTCQWFHPNLGPRGPFTCFTTIGSGKQVFYPNNTAPENIDDDGDYKVEIAARDQFGNETTTYYAFTVDNTPPQIEFTHTPFDPDDGEPGTWGDPTNSRLAELRYRFDTSGEEIDEFYCRLSGDAAEPVAPCTSPHFYGPVTPGNYTVTVTATDLAGNESAPIAHDVTVAFPTYTTDACDAGGPVQIINEFQKAVGYNRFPNDPDNPFDASDGNIDPLDSYLWQSLSVESAIRFDYSYKLDRTFGLPTTSHLWGHYSSDHYVGRSITISSPTGSACANSVSIDHSTKLHAGGFSEYQRKWSYQSAYRTKSSDFDTPHPIIVRDYFDMSHPDFDHLVLRHASPPRGWLISAGDDWHVRFQGWTQYSDGATPTAVAVTATSPYGDLLTDTVIDWDELDGADGGLTKLPRLDVLVEPPFCSGYFDLKATALPATNPNMVGTLRVPVMDHTAAGTSEQYEPDNTDTTAADLALPVTLANRIAPTGGADDQDWYRLTGAAAGPLTVRVIDPAVAPAANDVLANQAAILYTTLYEDVGADGLPPYLPVATANTKFDGVADMVDATAVPGNAYFVKVTAPAAPACLRYRVETEQ